MNHTIGTCSNCGGRVSVPRVYMSVVAPIPRCEKCGACMAQPHGSVIQMAPTPKSPLREFPTKEFAELLQEKFRGTCWEPLVRAGWSRSLDEEARGCAVTAAVQRAAR